MDIELEIMKGNQKRFLSEFNPKGIKVTRNGETKLLSEMRGLDEKEKQVYDLCVERAKQSTYGWEFNLEGFALPNMTKRQITACIAILCRKKYILQSLSSKNYCVCDFYSSHNEGADPNDYNKLFTPTESDYKDRDLIQMALKLGITPTLDLGNSSSLPYNEKYYTDYGIFLYS